MYTKNLFPFYLKKHGLYLTRKRNLMFFYKKFFKYFKMYGIHYFHAFIKLLSNVKENIIL